MRKWMSLVFAMLLAAYLYAPGQASAKAAKDACAKADQKLSQSGVGDSDGDGVSDCRETRYLHTDPTNPDTDGDKLPDGEDFKTGCNPLNPDSDDDGIEDGDDASPAVVQKMQALLDALTCPQLDVPGSISALGTTAVLDMTTEFEDSSCAQLATLLAAGSGNVMVKIEIIEDALGALTAKEVELEERHHHVGGYDWDGGYDD